VETLIIRLGRSVVDGFANKMTVKLCDDRFHNSNCFWVFVESCG